MSPRPIDLPEHPFANELTAARDGGEEEAVRAIEHAWSTAPDREAVATPAATALAEVARLAEQRGEEALAVRALDAALAARPRFADLHFRRACLLVAMQRRPEARGALEAALKINPRYVAARVELALLDARDGLIGDALERLSGLKDEAAIADGRAFGQGLRSLERADWDEADSLLKRALDIRDPALQQQLSEIRDVLEQGDPGRAADALRRVLQRHPAYPDLHDLLGMAELKLGHYDDAMSSFARALELNPAFHSARVHFAQSLEALGMITEAQAQLLMVSEADPGNPEASLLAERWSERGAERREDTAA